MRTEVTCSNLPLRHETVTSLIPTHTKLRLRFQLRNKCW